MHQTPVFSVRVSAGGHLYIRRPILRSSVLDIPCDLPSSIIHHTSLYHTTTHRNIFFINMYLFTYIRRPILRSSVLDCPKSSYTLYVISLYRRSDIYIYILSNYIYIHISADPFCGRACWTVLNHHIPYTILPPPYVYLSAVCNKYAINKRSYRRNPNRANARGALATPKP